VSLHPTSTPFTSNFGDDGCEQAERKGKGGGTAWRAVPVLAHLDTNQRGQQIACFSARAQPVSVRSGLMLDANDWREHPSTLIDAYH